MGYAEIFIGHWTGIFALKGTQDEFLEKISSAVGVALKPPTLRARGQRSHVAHARGLSQ